MAIRIHVAAPPQDGDYANSARMKSYSAASALFVRVQIGRSGKEELTSEQ
jgi:hypothetical protein